MAAFMPSLLPLSLFKLPSADLAVPTAFTNILSAYTYINFLDSINNYMIPGSIIPKAYLVGSFPEVFHTASLAAVASAPFWLSLARSAFQPRSTMLASILLH